MNSKRMNKVETLDARYYGYIEMELVNDRVLYVATIWARGFEDDNSVNTKISTAVKYEIGDARRFLFRNIGHYSPRVS